MRPHLIFQIILLACGKPEAPSEVAPSSTTELRDDLRFLYDSASVSGSFILHDMSADRWVYIDSAQADVATSPASTFKIFSCLYALESELVRDETAIFGWDGDDYGRPEVNKNLTLRESVELSAYWVHRDIARMAGANTLKQWLDSVGYGNADTTGGYDQCWVRGGLRITPRQQVDLLERMLRDQLPFSERNVSIVRSLIIQQDTLGHRLYGKTGWALGEKGSIGWFVGWVEKRDGGGPYVFANRIETTDTASETFPAARRAIALDVLKRLGVLPE